MLAAMAFVPENDVEQSFNMLRSQRGQPEVPVEDYFQRTYVGVPRQGGRHRGIIPPMFPNTLWNMHDRITSL